MNKYQKFDCGCSFAILKEFEDGRQPLVDFDISKVNYDCQATWKIFEQGLTAGVFQLESHLGKHYSKELKPNCLEHITAMGALLRPGTLGCRDDKGVSMTDHYCLRKNGKESVESYHPIIDEILKPTYGILVYQEQFMQASQVVAGFSLLEVDRLRKATGKKDQKEMSEIMGIFKKKALEKGLVDEVTLDKLIENIKATGRYSFNKSHAASYGLETYQTAYLKAHFPLAFYTAKLKGARFKVKAKETLQELINEAKLFNIEVKLPDIRDRRSRFYTDGKIIKFGISDIKGIGDSVIKKIKEALKDYSFTTFFDFAKLSLFTISDSTVLKMIDGGALDCFGMSRSQMSAEYKVLAQFNNNEQILLKDLILKENPSDIISLFKLAARKKKDGGVGHQQKRVEFLQELGKTLENPIVSYVDSPLWICHSEEELLGYPITFQKIDSCDTSEINTSCKEFMAGKDGFLILGVDIKTFTEKAISRGDNKGKKFASLKISDASCMIDGVAWPEVYEEFREVLTPGNSVIIQGERNFKKKDSNTVVIKRVWQAK